MEQVFEQTIIETNPEVEKHKKSLEEIQGISAEEEQVV